MTSGDFHFSALPTQSERQIPLQISDPRAIVINPDSEIMFSGGADSLCAAIESVHEKHLKPILYPGESSLDTAGQCSAARFNAEATATLPPLEVPAPSSGFIVKVGMLLTAVSARAFLFACLGTAIAAERGFFLQLGPRRHRALLPRQMWVAADIDLRKKRINWARNGSKLSKNGRRHRVVAYVRMSSAEQGCEGFSIPA